MALLALGACSSVSNTPSDGQTGGDGPQDLGGDARRDGAAGEQVVQEGGPNEGGPTGDTGPALTHIWSKRFGSNGDDHVRGVGVDPSGNITITGSFHGTVSLGGKPLVSWAKADIFVASFDAAGNHRWSQRYGGSEDDSGEGVAVDKSGNVYITGWSGSSQTDFGGGALGHAGGGDIVVASFDKTGAHRWSKRFGGANWQYGNELAVDASGNVTVVGSTENSLDFGGGTLSSHGYQDVFVASFDSGGAYRWANLFGSNSNDGGSDVAVDASGNVYLTGYYGKSMDLGGTSHSCAGGTDIFVASFSSMGLYRWSKGLGFPSDDAGRAVALDSAGNVTVAGVFQGTVNFGGGLVTSTGARDIFLASYDTSGKFRWAKAYGGTDDEYPNALLIDKAGNHYLLGDFATTTNLGGGALTSAGGKDIILASFDKTGGHRYSRAFGYPSDDYGASLVFDSTGNLVLGGDFTVGLDLGGDVLIGQGGSDAFLGKLVP